MVTYQESEKKTSRKYDISISLLTGLLCMPSLLSLSLFFCSQLFKKSWVWTERVPDKHSQVSWSRQTVDPSLHRNQEGDSRGIGPGCGGKKPQTSLFRGPTSWREQEHIDSTLIFFGRPRLQSRVWHSVWTEFWKTGLLHFHWSLWWGWTDFLSGCCQGDSQEETPFLVTNSFMLPVGEALCGKVKVQSSPGLFWGNSQCPKRRLHRPQAVVQHLLQPCCNISFAEKYRKFLCCDRTTCCLTNRNPRLSEKLRGQLFS